VNLTRSKSIDPIVIRDNWTGAYRFVAGPAIGELSEYAKAHDPFANVGSQAVNVEIVSVLARSPNTYQVHGANDLRPGRLERDRELDGPLHRQAYPAQRTRRSSGPTRWASSSHHSSGAGSFSLMRKGFLRTWRAPSLAILLALTDGGFAASAPTAVDPAKPVVAPEAPPRPIRVVHHRRRPVHRRVVARSGPLRTVQAANSASRSGPISSAYINAALYYDFEPGRLYTVNTSPRFLTAITLRPGEKLISKAAGDTVRWVLGRDGSREPATASR